MIVQYKDVSEIIDKKSGYTKEIINELIDDIIRSINSVARKVDTFNLPIRIEYDETLVTQVIIDAVEDLKRLQRFHPVVRANAIKEAAYIGFWWIRRKPMSVIGNIAKLEPDGKDAEQIKKIKANLLFINEVAVSRYILPKIFDLRDEITECATVEKTKNWSKARANLVYFLSYRADSPKSIEAILSSLTLHPIWSLKHDFWEDRDVEE